MKIYRKVRKQFLTAVFSFVTVFAWVQDTSFHELVKTATPPQEIKEEINNGANIEARGERERTPLMYAAWFNQNPGVITTMLDAGADGKARNKEGKNAFDSAQENEHLKGTDANWMLSDSRFYILYT